jgi:hypothetical protein
MHRIANSRHSIAVVLISLAVALVTPVSAWASQGSPGCF